MTADEYLIGGFAAMFAVTILFPVHCIAVAAALIGFGMLIRIAI